MRVPFLAPSLPAPLRVAKQRLEQHQRELIMARIAHQQSLSVVAYHEGAAAELKKMVDELENVHADSD